MQEKTAAQAALKTEAEQDAVSISKVQKEAALTAVVESKERTPVMFQVSNQAAVKPTRDTQEIVDAKPQGLLGTGVLANQPKFRSGVYRLMFQPESNDGTNPSPSFRIKIELLPASDDQQQQSKPIAGIPFGWTSTMSSEGANFVFPPDTSLF